MTRLEQSDLYLWAEDYIECIFSELTSPAYYDLVRLCRIIIKHEVTSLILAETIIGKIQLQILIEGLFHVIVKSKGYLKLFKSDKIIYRFQVEERQFIFELKNINEYLCGNGYESLEHRNDRINLQIKHINDWIPLYFKHLIYPGKTTAQTIIQKVLWRIPIDHFFIDDSDFQIAFDWLMKQWLNKNALFSIEETIRLEPYQITGSRPLIIKHPEHYEKRSHPFGSIH
jgi:hypothetical protein